MPFLHRHRAAASVRFMKVLDAPTLWLVTLHGGSVAQVWANALTQPTADEDRYVFCVLMDASREEQWNLDITARTPSDPQRVEVCVARFPAPAVVSVVSGMAGQ